MSRPLRNFGDLEPKEHRDAGLSVRNAGLSSQRSGPASPILKGPAPCLRQLGQREETGGVSYEPPGTWWAWSCRPTL